MSSSALRTAWYRTAACWKRQRASYVVLVVLIGLAGGIALGSLAAARRTASSFPTFLAASNPSDLEIVPAGAGPNGSAGSHLQSIIHAVRSYPQVKRVESYVALNASLVKGGRTERRSLNSKVVLVGSVDGLLFNQDRFAVTSGRMADPARADEVMVTENAAAAMGLHLGSRVPVAIPTGTGSQAPRRITLKVVGIGLLNREVVQDQIAKFPTYIVGDAGPHEVGRRSANSSIWACSCAVVRPTSPRWNGAGTRASVLHRLSGHVAGRGGGAAVDTARGARPRGVRRYRRVWPRCSSRMQVIARELGARERDLVVMRAVGAGPATTELDGLIGIVASVLAGSRPRRRPWRSPCPRSSPSGRSGPSTPTPASTRTGRCSASGSPSCSAPWSRRPWPSPSATRRTVRMRRSRPVGRRSSTVRLAARSGLPPSAVAGASFAVDGQSGRAAGPYRWSLLSAVIAMIVVTTTLTFGASLHTLVSQPALYGWNWDYAVQSSDGYGPVPDQAVATLRHDPAVAVVLGRLVRDVAARRRRGAHVAVCSQVGGRSAHRLGARVVDVA